MTIMPSSSSFSVEEVFLFLSSPHIFLCVAFGKQPPTDCTPRKECSASKPPTHARTHAPPISHPSYLPSPPNPQDWFCSVRRSQTQILCLLLCQTRNKETLFILSWKSLMKVENYQSVNGLVHGSRVLNIFQCLALNANSIHRVHFHSSHDRWFSRVQITSDASWCLLRGISFLIQYHATPTK